jgi:hypothetical protein
MKDVYCVWCSKILFSFSMGLIQDYHPLAYCGDCGDEIAICKFCKSVCLATEKNLAFAEHTKSHKQVEI